MQKRDLRLPGAMKIGSGAQPYPRKALALALDQRHGDEARLQAFPYLEALRLWS